MSGVTNGLHRRDRKILYIDMAHTVERVRARGQSAFFEMRHSGGYFRDVWGVHPLADVAGSSSRQIETIKFSDKQHIIEAVAEALPLPRLLLPLNFLYSQSKLIVVLVKLIRRESIDVIAATDCYYSGLLGVILQRMTNRPLVVSVFGNPDEMYEATGALQMPRLLRFRAVERALAHFVLSRSKLVITQNENNMAFAKKNGASGITAIIPAAKHIQPVHFVPPEKRQPSRTLKRLGIPPGAPLMLYVGRLLPLKHPDEAIKAMARVIDRVPSAMGLLAGDGPMERELRELIAALGKTRNIHLIGTVDQEELSRLSPRCITVSPLTGMALVECALAGSPLVVFDRDWQAEFVKDWVNGFVVPFRDNEAMAERVRTILCDEGLRAKLSKGALRSGLDQADVDRIYAEEHKQFDRLLASPAKCVRR